tara:strand:- start:387 stop:545 length:159 start_codon:yes stop_codon:yes gene_type:complete
MPMSLQMQITKNQLETKKLVQSVVATLERLDQRIKTLEIRLHLLAAPQPPTK